MITKAQLVKTIENFPDEFPIDELMDKLILLDKITEGDRDSLAGRTTSEEALENEMREWSNKLDAIDILRVHHSSRDLERREIR